MRKVVSMVSPGKTVAFCIFCCVSACTGTVADPQAPPAGSSALTQSAYRDGCTSGYHDVGHVGYDGNENDRLNRALYKAEAEYRAGYDLGYKTCREDDLRTPHRYFGAP